MNFVNVDFENEGGTIEGYFHLNSAENIYNYFNENSVDISVIDFLKNETNIFVIGLIRNLWIEDEKRGNGFGTDLINQMVDYMTDNADLFFLIADNLEDNEFSLENWYEKFGLQTLCNTGQGPLMVAGSEDLIESLRHVLSSKSHALK